MGDAELDSFDPTLTSALTALLSIQARYHRLEVRGLERIPDGPALIVGNHSGGAAPVDGLFLTKYYERFGTSEPLHILAHQVFFKVPAVARALAKVGVIEATPASARRALERGRKVLVFPGTDFDSLRTFRDRKRVFLANHHGFARLAVATGAPIVPMATAGAHEGFIVLTQGKRVMRALGGDKLLRWHSFPVALCLPYGVAIGPACYLPYLPLPAKIVVEMGEPLAPAAFCGENGALGRRDDGRDAGAVRALYSATEARLQGLLDQLYSQRRLPIWG